MDNIKMENNNYIKDINPILKYDNISNDIINFYFQINQLKNLYRQGWLKRILGLEYKDKCESVADHCFGLGMLAISIIEKYKLNYDMAKCLKLCLLHELGEIYAGDFFVPKDNITEAQKHQLERGSIIKVLSNVNFENDFLELWEEYEEQKTDEAVFIKELDKLEFLMQAAVYETDISYYKYTISKIKTPIFIELLEELKNLTINKKPPIKT